MKNKKIVGYKLIQDLPDLKAGAVFNYSMGSWKHKLDNKRGWQFFDSHIKDTRWFEPIFEEAQSYFFINSEGQVHEARLSGEETKNRKEFGNCFETKEQAQSVRDILSVLLTNIC